MYSFMQLRIKGTLLDKNDKQIRHKKRSSSYLLLLLHICYFKKPKLIFLNGFLNFLCYFTFPQFPLEDVFQ